MNAFVPPTGWLQALKFKQGGVGHKAPPNRGAHAPITPPVSIRLPLGGTAEVYTRDQLIALYNCSHGELGRLMVRKFAPLPIRVDGLIVWFADESIQARTKVTKVLDQWRR